MPRDPALRPYRVSLYVAFGVVCAVLFAQLLRSVMGDLYGRRPDSAPVQGPTACLEDVERLYAQISARAVQPAPGGLEGGALAREWDAWTRRWEDEMDRVSQRCSSGAGGEASQALAEALDGIEELRRRLSRSGEETAEEARRVKEALARARRELKVR
ncbi:MAG TPA: hypothetical protein VMK66_09330 [Myxococcales bacterium]|nr:hypothetical protein [Myxococcales bacterium]